LFSGGKSGKCENNDQECGECFIKAEELHKLKQTVDSVTQEICQLKQQNEVLSEDNNKMAKDERVLSKELLGKQVVILEQLEQRIDASVYQKVLLEQARGIEDLIKCERHSYARDKKRVSQLDSLYRTVFPSNKEANNKI
jgi:cell division protein FtsB